MIKKSVLFFMLCVAAWAYGKGSYSSGSRSTSSFSSSRSSSTSFSSSKPSSTPNRSYSSGNSIPKSSNPSSGSKSFFSKADKAQAVSISKSNYAQYKATKASKYNVNPQSYDYLKTQPKEVYTTRIQRQQSVFNNYYNQPRPQVVYRDSGWNPFFWMWLMDRPNQQAEWVYHHRSELSDERYKDLLAKNKDLEKQLKELDDKKVAKDPNFAPKEVDKDLMYSDDYVKDVQKDDDTNNWLWFLLGTSLVLGAVGFGVYAIFFRKREF